MSCPYDTNHDGDCHLCSKAGWFCGGEAPVQDTLTSYIRYGKIEDIEKLCSEYKNFQHSPIPDDALVRKIALKYLPHSTVALAFTHIGALAWEELAIRLATAIHSGDTDAVRDISSKFARRTP